jgi:hypothetical protein
MEHTLAGGRSNFAQKILTQKLFRARENNIPEMCVRDRTDEQLLRA